MSQFFRKLNGSNRLRYYRFVKTVEKYLNKFGFYTQYGFFCHWAMVVPLPEKEWYYTTYKGRRIHHTTTQLPEKMWFCCDGIVNFRLRII